MVRIASYAYRMLCEQESVELTQKKSIAAVIFSKMLLRQNNYYKGGQRELLYLQRADNYADKADPLCVHHPIIIYRLSDNPDVQC